MKITTIQSTTTLSLTTTAVDRADLLPDGVSNGDGIVLLFFGDNTEIVYMGNADKSKRIPIPVGATEYSTINRDTWVAAGMTYFWAAAATDVTVSVLPARG
jgi:hypothetical protein